MHPVKQECPQETRIRSKGQKSYTSQRRNLSPGKRPPFREDWSRDSVGSKTDPDQDCSAICISCHVKTKPLARTLKMNLGSHWTSVSSSQFGHIETLGFLFFSNCFFNGLLWGGSWAWLVKAGSAQAPALTTWGTEVLVIDLVPKPYAEKTPRFREGCERCVSHETDA